jgi:hypothetical protein
MGPNGERLDQQGLRIPERSVGARVTITDYGNMLD